jgi:hypothetical protein
LYNEAIHVLYSSQNIIWVFKSRGMRWMGHVARIEQKIMYTGPLWEYLKETDHLEDLATEGRKYYSGP